MNDDEYIMHLDETINMHLPMMSNQRLRGAFFWSLATLSLCQFVGRCSASSSTSQSGDEGFSRLVNWMIENGGRVDNRFGVVEKDELRGIQAFGDIEEGSELVFCPWSLVIGSSGLDTQMQPGDGMCKVVDEMAREIRLGANSLWQPYLDHIGGQRLPADWSSDALAELQGLLSSQDAIRHLRWFDARCDGELDKAAKVSLVAFISRASEVGMVPIYDLFNHHNGMRNAKLSVTEAGVQLLVVGGKIPSGNEIYISYGLKTAVTMYRDYGFVEPWPTAWNWATPEGNNFAFLSFPDGVIAINPSADLLKAVWQSNMSLEEYQSLATAHTESLSSIDLETFASAVEHGHFPTTCEDDEISLDHLLLDQKSGIDTSSNIQDKISALRYRIAHKKALTSAKLSCNEILAKRIKMSQEL